MPNNISISNDTATVTISPDAGASLRSIRVRKNGAEYELLAGGTKQLDPTELPHGDGSFIMAPWVNRLRDGRLVASDGDHFMPVNSPPHAIHGLLRERPWEVISQAESSLVLSIDLEEPWPYEGKVEYALSLDGNNFVQTMTLTASDNESRSFPGSVGWHPWFNKSLGSDVIEAKADIEGQWELDSTVTATGSFEVTDTTRRLLDGTKFATGEVDGCFLRSTNGKAILKWPELTLTMDGSEEITHFMFYSPEHALCVEPQTTTVDGTRLASEGFENTGHVEVSSNSPLSATTTWSWE